MHTYHLENCNTGCATRVVWGFYNNTPREERGRAFMRTIAYSTNSLPRQGTLAFMFADSTGPNGKGESIAAWLRENKMGEVVETPPFKNGTYGTQGASVKVWVFMPDPIVAIPYCEKLLKKDEEERQKLHGSISSKFELNQSSDPFAQPLTFTVRGYGA